MRYFLVALSLLMTACAGPARLVPPPLLRTPISRINADGSRTKVSPSHLTSFQVLVRSRLAPVPETAVAAVKSRRDAHGEVAAKMPGVQELYLLEVDQPQGEGTEGAYLAVLRSSAGAEFQYYEQKDHRPRHDRYFHRMLLPEELAALTGFLAAHPLPELRVPAAPPATAPAARGAGGSAAGQGGGEFPEPTAADDAGEQPLLQFRFTDAQWGEATTVEMNDPTEEDRGAIGLIRMFAAMRDRSLPYQEGEPSAAFYPPLTCSYFQPIPTNATVLFANPLHHVLSVWCNPADGSDLRVLVVPPLEQSATREEIPQAAATQAAATEGAGPSEDRPRVEPRWYVRAGESWVAGDAPPVAETEPAAAIEHAPATEPAMTERASTGPALAPSLPPMREKWAAEPGGGGSSTNLWHYLPIDASHGQWLGFVIPNLVFDSSQFTLDPSHTLLYLIHDGVLLSLPIPASALTLK